MRTMKDLMKFVAVGLLVTIVACGGGDKPEEETADTAGTTTTVSTTPTSTTDVGPPYRLIGDHKNLPASALLSIWGTDSSNVWTVGSDDGAGPVVLHYDGSSWSRIDTGTTGDLWWVWGDGEGTVWFSGANGRVVKHDVATGVSEERAIAEPQITLFGFWGASESDLWAVGGDINLTVGGVVLHSTDGGEKFASAGDVPMFDVSQRMAFKVWGRSSSEVFVVGTNALIMQWDGTTLNNVDPSPLYHSTPLTTVAGGANEVLAVGGYGNAAVARYADGVWSDDSPPPQKIAREFIGVSVRDGVGAVACGVQGSIWWRTDKGWASGGESQTLHNFHACWIDPDGDIWAVGGDLSGFTEGVLAYSGDVVPDVSL
jgi:hypothetical protein